jgi:hypothetical protein
MNNRTISVLSALAFIGIVVAAACCYHEYETLGALRAQILGSELQPIAALLAENQKLIRELQAPPFIEPDSGILESYLVKIRRDGVPKNADMKQRLDQLAESNTAIVTLIKAYSHHAKTPGFTTEADKFRNYASAWRDRWNSLMEIFMAGGNYAVSQVQFPKDFPDAIQAEIAATK